MSARPEGPDAVDRQARPFRNVAPVGLVMALLLVACSAAAIGVVQSAGTSSGSSAFVRSLVQASRYVVPAPVTGFGGYRIEGPVAQISAAWHVPTIAPDSPPGHASTWVGVQNRAGDFIQIGTTEDVDDSHGHAQAQSSAPLYRAFWTDTDHRFLPLFLGTVRPGDPVEVSMVQSASGWSLHLRDDAAGLRVDMPPTYGGGRSFDQAEWVQEDPVPFFNSPEDTPYPSMSRPVFTSVEENGSTPSTTYQDARALVSPNGITLVPGDMVDGGFSFHGADPAQTRYLTFVMEFDVVVGESYAARQNPANTTDASDLARRIAQLDMTLAQAPWPPAAAGPVADMLLHNAGLVEALDAWAAAPPAQRATKLAAVVRVFGSDRSTSDRVRAALGLPPV